MPSVITPYYMYIVWHWDIQCCTYLFWQPRGQALTVPFIFGLPFLMPSALTPYYPPFLTTWRPVLDCSTRFPTLVGPWLLKPSVLTQMVLHLGGVMSDWLRMEDCLSSMFGVLLTWKVNSTWNIFLNINSHFMYANFYWTHAIVQVII